VQKIDEFVQEVISRADALGFSEQSPSILAGRHKNTLREINGMDGHKPLQRCWPFKTKSQYLKFCRKKIWPPR